MRLQLYGNSISYGIDSNSYYTNRLYFINEKAIKRHNYMIMSVALLLAIYSFCESQMLEVYSSFVYFYLIADDIVLDDSKAKIITNNI